MIDTTELRARMRQPAWQRGAVDAVVLELLDELDRLRAENERRSELLDEYRENSVELMAELDRLRAMTPAGVVELLEERNSLLAENRRLRGGWQAVRDDGPDATLMVKP